MKIEPAGDFPEKPAEFVRYHGYYDRTIFYSPVNKFCILSITRIAEGFGNSSSEYTGGMARQSDPASKTGKNPQAD